MVEGQPVAVQSPARMQLGQGDGDAGLMLSMPGGTPKVARTSLIERGLFEFRFFDRWKEFREFAQCLVDGLLTVEGREGAGRGLNELEIAACMFTPRLQSALVVHPVNFAVEQNGVR